MKTRSAEARQLAPKRSPSPAIESQPSPARHSKREPMVIGCVTDQTQHLDDVLRRRIIGQDSSVEALVCSFSRVLSGLRDPSRPVLNILLLGPTGVGKTETAKAVAQTVFGSE